MYALDFEYDGKYLSDFGFIICNFNGSSVDTINVGSVITFNKTPFHSGKSFGLSSTQYEECIQATFTICKNPKIYKNAMSISNNEYRDVVRWLNRRGFFKFQLIGSNGYDSDTCFYYASFNIEKIKIDETLYGIELTMETDKPFGYGQELLYTWDVTETNSKYVLLDMSDEIGFTYPSIEIVINKDGDLSLYNDMEKCNMIIRNCSSGEVITIDGVTKIIKTSISSHLIYNDFNFDYFRISNTILSRNNNLTCNLPCKIKFRYFPIVKDLF